MFVELSNECVYRDFIKLRLITVGFSDTQCLACGFLCDIRTFKMLSTSFKHGNVDMYFFVNFKINCFSDNVH